MQTTTTKPRTFTRSRAIVFTSGATKVTFVPAHAPPFTHRVIVQNGDRFAKSWYDPTVGHKINAKTAAYYADKFAL